MRAHVLPALLCLVVACGARTLRPEDILAVANADRPVGSAAWNRAVGDLLLGAYDVDDSGYIDTRAELARVPCEVLRALDLALTDASGAAGTAGRGLRARYGLPMAARLYRGDLLGFGLALRAQTDAHVQSCGITRGA